MLFIRFGIVVAFLCVHLLVVVVLVYIMSVLSARISFLSLLATLFERSSLLPPSLVCGAP